MRKKLLTCLLCLFCLTGCNQQKTISYLDVNNIFSNLNKITYKSNDKYYPAFTKLVLEDDNTIKKVYGLDTNTLKSYAVYAPILEGEANMCMILSVNEGEKEKVKKQADSFFIKYEKFWKVKDKTQYNLVKDRAFLEKDGYLFYVVSRNNVDVLKEIENSFETIEVSNAK